MALLRPPVCMFVGSFVLASSLLVAPHPARADATADVAAAAQKEAVALVERLKSADVGSRSKAIDDAAKNQHPLVSTALGRLVGDIDDATRPALLAALVGRTEPVAKKAAALAVGARVERIAKSDEAYAERQKLIAALHDLAQPSALRVLAAETGLDVTSEELAARMKAIANLPSADAIEEIIQFRSSGGRLGKADELGYRRRIARQAFAYAVGVDVGHDPDAMRAWWKDHEKGFDFASAAARRGKAGGGPSAKEKDGKSPDTGSK